MIKFFKISFFMLCTLFQVWDFIVKYKTNLCTIHQTHFITQKSKLFNFRFIINF